MTPLDEQRARLVHDAITRLDHDLAAVGLGIDGFTATINGRFDGGVFEISERAEDAPTYARPTYADDGTRQVPDATGPLIDYETVDEHPREDAVRVITTALARLECGQPVDPYDPEDCGSVASEAVWALIRAGMLPAHSQAVAEPSQELAQPAADLREALLKAWATPRGYLPEHAPPYVRRYADEAATVLAAHVAAEVERARAAAEVAIDDVDDHQQDPERPVPADWRAGWHGACIALRAALDEYLPGADEPEAVTELRRAFEAAIRSGGPVPYLSTEHPDQIRERARAEGAAEALEALSDRLLRHRDDLHFGRSPQMDGRRIGLEEAATIARSLAVDPAARIAAGGEQRG